MKNVFTSQFGLFQIELKTIFRGFTASLLITALAIFTFDVKEEHSIEYEEDKIPWQTFKTSGKFSFHKNCDVATHHHSADKFLFQDLNPIQERVMLQLISKGEVRERPEVCWHPETEQKTIEAFYAKNDAPPGNSLVDDPNKYQLGGRWSTTASNGGGLSQGDPTTLTWSFVPRPASSLRAQRFHACHQLERCPWLLLRQKRPGAARIRVP